MPTDLQALFSDLIRLETELWTAVDRRLMDLHDLPLSWYEPMKVIDTASAGTVSDIVETLAITVGGASKLVDRIEHAGFMRRAPHPTDGRSSLIALTDAGLRKLAAAEDTINDELHRLVASALPPASLEQFASFLGSLRSAMPE